MKRCSAAWVKELQIKTMRCYDVPIRTAKTQKTHTTKCWPRCGITGILIHCWWKCNGTATSGHSLAVSYKTKHKRCRNYACWYLPKRIENLNQHKNLYTGVNSYFIRKCQILEASKMSFRGEWINKLQPI